jgi:S-adenosylmethionine decarboxylase
MSQSLGRHVILDIWVKDGKFLEDTKEVRERIEDVISDKVEIVSFSHHDFGPTAGVTALWLLKESHVSVHSWPELNFVAIDCFTCGTVNPLEFVNPLLLAFNAVKWKLTDVKRGDESIAHPNHELQDSR